jgi:hypothetical protein
MKLQSMIHMISFFVNDGYALGEFPPIEIQTPTGNIEHWEQWRKSLGFWVFDTGNNENEISI